MDDDDLRRGRPTCHKQFDEATAILAGDALQALAFYILSHDPQIVVPAAQRLKMIETLALYSGSRGMAGGQAIDLESVGKTLNIAQLETMHIHKTGALIRTCIQLAALCHSQQKQTGFEALIFTPSALACHFRSWTIFSMSLQTRRHWANPRDQMKLYRSRPSLP